MSWFCLCHYNIFLTKNIHKNVRDVENQRATFIICSDKNLHLLDQNFPSVQPMESLSLSLSLDLMGPKGNEWFSAPIWVSCTHFTPIIQARGSPVPSSLLSMTWASLVATTSKTYLESKASLFWFTAMALASGHIIFHLNLCTGLPTGLIFSVPVFL